MSVTHPYDRPRETAGVSGSILTLCALLLAAPAAAQPAAITWDRALWDPADPVPGQIALPLPCGAGMAFVPVETPVDVDNPLADRQIQLGGADRETGYIDYFRTEHLRGGFTVDGAALYYLAKYEVTRDQWMAVMGDACPTPGRRGARAQGDMSWFDAVAFTRRMSEWLRREAPGALPTVGEAPGFVRLPTEAEWEFAARGGAAVDVADFRAALPPMDGVVGDYAWHAGPRSANGSFRPIGLKRPNPLGVHGMFGGVEELVLEPFRLNRLGREHGQVGGFVTRGGSIATEATLLRSAMRSEWPFFNVVDGTATAFETFGLRPVLSAPVNVSLAYTNRVRDRWMADAAAEPRAGADPLGVLDALAERETDVRLRNELAVIRAEILSDRRARDEADARALRLSLLNGATLGNWMRQERTNRDINERQLSVVAPALAEEDLSDALRERYARARTQFEQRIAQADENLAVAGSAYLAGLYEMIDRYAPDELDRELDILVIELEERDQAALTPKVRQYRDVIGMVRADPSLSREAILAAAH